MTALDERVAAPKTRREIQAESDLGFGSVVARESRQRLLNRDGTFNVRREGLHFWQSLSAYHYLLTISWLKFFSLVVMGFLATNAFFALLYTAAGEGALTGTHAGTVHGRFVEEFFFSVHTLATIGYGTIAPATLVANVIVTIETLVGLVSVAVVAGISFARFSRPVSSIAFSRNAVIAPYGSGRAFMFRIVNRRSSELVDVEAKVMLSRRKRDSPGDREFLSLKLERDRVSFFPLSWTVVHPIDADSPLQEWDPQEAATCDAEFLVLLNAFDETFSQTVHTRSSYKADEIVWGARFASMFQPRDEKGTISVDIRKLHDIERVSV